MMSPSVLEQVISRELTRITISIAEIDQHRELPFRILRIDLGEAVPDRGRWDARSWH